MSLLYDILNWRSAEKTVLSMLGVGSFDEALDLYSKDQLLTQRLCDLDFQDINFSCYHITTSANECSSIKDKGLLPLVDILQDDDAELTRFIKEKTKMDVSELLSLRSEKTSLFNQHVRVQTKLKGDNRVSAYLYYGDQYDEFDLYPEILKDIFPWMSSDELSRLWGCEPYVVRFVVDASQVNSIYGFYSQDDINVDGGRRAVHCLFDHAWSHCLQNYTRIPITLKEEVVVPKEQILGFEQIERSIDIGGS